MIDVMVVDDEPDILDALELLWEASGIKIRTAPSAEAALAGVDHAPDVLLTDYRMPGMDGIQLVKKMRERFPGLPAVLMTAFHDAEIAAAAREAGIVDVVRKPFDANDLMERVIAAVR